MEFHKSNDGVPLHGRDELWLPYPIEYKHGKSKTIDADRLQLCAEAMCLEEMLACDILEQYYDMLLRKKDGNQSLYSLMIVPMMVPNRCRTGSIHI